MTEERNDLTKFPNGWTWAKVTDLKGGSGFICDGDWILTEDLKTGNDVRLIQLADIGEGQFLNKSRKFISKNRSKELDCTFLGKGDILISRMAEPIARACILPKLDYDCITAVDVAILRVDSNYFDKNYVCWLFNSKLIRNQAESLSSGTTRKRISRKKLETLNIPVPPFQEQHRIAAKIEELFSVLDAGVESLRKVKAQLKRYRQAVLKYAFEGKLTEEWRKTHKDQTPPVQKLLENGKDSKGSQQVNSSGMDEEWAEIKLETCSNLITKGESPKWQGFKYVDEGVIFIRSKNVLWGVLELSDAVKIPKEFHNKLTRSQLKAGDVLINLVGASIGRCGIVPPFIKTANINQAVAVIRTNDSLLPSYLMYLLLSPKIQEEIQNSKVETARPNISLQDLRQLTVPLPSISAQHKIVEEIELRFSLSQEVEKITEQGSKQADRLRQSILKSAFEGKLVPQDPADEPAEKLLERIKEERARQMSKEGTNKIKTSKGTLKEVGLLRYV